MVVDRPDDLLLMKVFVVHRFKHRQFAKRKLKEIAQAPSLEFKPVFLDSSKGDLWKQNARNAINEAEAVIVFDPESCAESDNAKWEIEKSKEAGKEIVELREKGTNEAAISKLKSLHNFEEEFGDCFPSGGKDILELYKMMVESSEYLIQRRQRTNAFFISAIGSLLAIAGFLAKTGEMVGGSFWILCGFSVVGLLLCNSWRNLIDNYGKLNSAKFDVILRLEKELSAQIYSAEWIALGKGLRPSKYRSFTSTEKNVPLFFGLLIAALTLIIIGWKIWG